MKRPTTFGLVAALLTALLLPGCAGTETGNPSIAPTTMALRTSDPDVATPAPGTGVVVQEAWLAAASLRMIEGAACDGVALRPSVVDAAGNLAIGVGTDGLPAGSFCGVHVELQPSDGLAPGAPEDLRGRAVFVRGTAADGVAFEIGLEGPITFEVRSPGADLAIADGDAFLLTFDVARWLIAIPLGAIPADADGVRRIEAGDADLAAFETGLVTSGELFFDADGNGLLDPGEEAAGALAVSH